ncbi:MULTISPECIES: hypothetical protein [unclassified Psychrobacter]|uniref:hypothetical protein n=1 Tax=unclassified Psychrobacter TaxID=196806 RepID=UPI00071E90E2|nr:MULTISPECIES: hypothetical protein [unclassified Psychrobacter]OLF38122.1 hypothetical protein BTV98_04555 [Psychrobacter sp. Cmf 22.2]
MQNKVPLPTDNVYKFFALFGLILLIFSLGATIYITKEANVQLIDIAIQLDNANSNNFSDETKNIIEGYREVIISDRDGFNNLLVGLAIFGTLLGLFGFSIWMFRIQPQQDKLVTFQLEKYKYEVDIESIKKSAILELQIEKEKLEIELLKKKQ